MHYGEIKKNDIANGEGIRVTLFVSGCRNHCKNCFQPQTWDFEYGNEFTSETEEYILSLLDSDYVQGLTILGGEPFEPSNQESLYPFLEKVKQRFPQKDIWMFSGFTLEEMRDKTCRANGDFTEKILSVIDVLVDGRFVEELKDITLKFRGSSNQRLINMKETNKQGKIVLWDS